MARNEGAFFRLIIILIITLLWLGISFVRMTNGYQEFGGIWLSGALSFALIVILFYLIFELYRARRAGKRVIVIMIWYLILVIPSFAAHFASFYTFFMKGELLTTEVKEKYSTLKGLKEDARLAFLANTGDPQQLSKLLSDLKSEVLSYALPGCSTRCKKILADINAERKKRMTKYVEIPPLPTAGKDLNKVYEDYERRLMGHDEYELVNKIGEDTKDPNPPANAINYPTLHGLNTIRDLVEKYGNYAREVQRKAPDTFKGPTSLIIENADLDNVSKAVRSAFKHQLDEETWISALAALVINLVVPVFVIGFIGTDSGRALSFVGSRRGAENLS